MLRQSRWKLIHYADGSPEQLFDTEADPEELRDLGGEPSLAQVQAELRATLDSILDPEAVNAQAFRDQAEMIAAYGGAEAILARPSFNHTPVAD